MNRCKPRRTLSVVPLYATGPDAPTLDEVRAQALPVLTRIFVSTIRAKRTQKTTERI